MRKQEEKGEKEDRIGGSVDKSGLSGHLLSFVLPAIFCHPFRPSFWGGKRLRSILVETLYRPNTLRPLCIGGGGGVDKRRERVRERERKNTAADGGGGGGRRRTC